MNRLRLLVLHAALGPLDYRLPDGVTAPPGSVVMAPLGPRKVMGIVWDEGRLPGEDIGFERLRPILEVLPVPPLPA
ncbi:MAG: primosomal protein N', partial [Porphyrobacter sp.]|nr:primosomal protein N' [Porphyrobacter sp.]